MRTSRQNNDVRQHDLFAEASPPTRAAAKISVQLAAPPLDADIDVLPPPARPRPPIVPLPDEDAMARCLEATGRYRVLRQLVPRSVRSAAWPAIGGSASLGLVVDTETTGLDHTRDEVIELGMVAFTYDETGIGEVVGVFSALEEPTVPIAPEIIRLTGITAEMVAGQRIDRDAAARFVERADLVIAHNAGFDRPFCERLVEGFAVKPWACSVKEVDWSALGFEGTKLGYLVGRCGWFHTGHRATDDCHALLEVLARPLPDHGGTAFDRLLAASRRTRVRIWADGSPFHMKEALKARRYRWSDGTDGRPKSWWIEVDEAEHEAELAYLRTEIYNRNVTPFSQRLTACDRFRR